MSNHLFAHASEPEQLTSHEALDCLNMKINSLSLGINGCDFQFIRNAISEKDSELIAKKIWRRIYNVGASRFSLRVLADSRDLHPAHFLNCRTGDGLIDHVSVNDAAIISALNSGGTLVFDHSQEYISELQIIQENLEAQIGCKCWIQCYVTKSEDTAFGMHGDDHPFIIVQLSGRKRWQHDCPNGTKLDIDQSEITYQPGDVAFYPRGKLHDVHGTGDLSVHLTIAFDGINGCLFEDIPKPDRLRSLSPRIGTSLPFSVCPDLVDQKTGVRLAYSNLPILNVEDTKYTSIETKFSTVRIPNDFVSVLRWLKNRRRTSGLNISEKFGLDIERCVTFIRFGLQNNLFINGLGE